MNNPVRSLIVITLYGLVTLSSTAHAQVGTSRDRTAWNPANWRITRVSTGTDTASSWSPFSGSASAHRHRECSSESDPSPGEVSSPTVVGRSSWTTHVREGYVKLYGPAGYIGLEPMTVKLFASGTAESAEQNDHRYRVTSRPYGQ